MSVSPPPVVGLPTEPHGGFPFCYRLAAVRGVVLVSGSRSAVLAFSWPCARHQSASRRTRWSARARRWASTFGAAMCRPLGSLGLQVRYGLGVHQAAERRSLVRQLLLVEQLADARGRDTKLP